MDIKLDKKIGGKGKHFCLVEGWGRHETDSLVYLSIGKMKILSGLSKSFHLQSSLCIPIPSLRVLLFSLSLSLRFSDVTKSLKPTNPESHNHDFLAKPMIMALPISRLLSLFPLLPIFLAFSTFLVSTGSLLLLGFFSLLFWPSFCLNGCQLFFCFFFHNRLCLEESVSLFACFCEWSALESVFLLLNLMNDEIIVLDLISFEFQWFISLVFFELDLGHTGGLQFSGSSFLNFQMGGWFWAFGLMRYALCMHNTLHKGFWFREFDEKSSVSSLFWKSIMIIITLLYFFYNVLFV